VEYTLGVDAGRPQKARPTMSTHSDDPARTVVLPALPAGPGSPAKPEDTTVTIAAVQRQRTPEQPPDLWERPDPPEPLDAPWLRRLSWILPAVLTASIAGIGVQPGPSHRELRWWADLAGDLTWLLVAPPIVAMAITAALVAAIGTKIGGRRVGVIAGFLFAVLPTTSVWARDPSPVMLSATAAGLLLLLLLDRARATTAVAYAGAVALLGAADAVAGGLLVAAHALAVAIGAQGRRTAIAWMIAAAAGGGAAGVLVWQRVVPGPVTGRRLSGAVADLPVELFGAALVAGAVHALGTLGASLRRPVVTLTLWALVPVAGLALAAVAVPMWHPAHLLVTVPAWTVLASAALRRFTLARGLSVAVAVALVAVPAHLDLRDRPAAVEPA
jgi:mannosyltransferase